jgi:uncharacterized protein YceK
MMKYVPLYLITGCMIITLVLSGCSSVMTHTGSYQGYYPGTRSDAEMLKKSDTGWFMTPCLVLDMPFSALLDTLLLPIDYFSGGKDNTPDSAQERIKTSEQHNKQISGSVDIDHVPSLGHTATPGHSGK